MASRDSFDIQCECGAKGELSRKENDAPYSKQWETWSVSGFDGEGFYIDGVAGVNEAIRRIQPKCRSCGKILQPSE